MMEETNDEQPEIVTHEEVALAEKEAAEGSTGNQLVVYFVDDRWMQIVECIFLSQ